MYRLAILAVLLAASVQAAVPELINFQGRLTDGHGAPLDTTIAIDFAIFDDTAGTTTLWEETHPGVVVRDGVFQVLLGSVKSFKASVFDGSVRYIGMAINGAMSDTLIPIVSIAYAIRATASDTASYAVTSRRADTATVALSGGGGSGGGWVDEGSFVTLIDPNDSVAIGTEDPQYPLDVEGSTNAIRGKSTGSGLAVGVTGIADNGGIGMFGYSVGGHGVYGLATGGKAGWFQGDAYVYGNLGLNIENPDERLHIYEAGSGDRAFLKIQTAHATNWGEAGLRIETPQNRWHLRMDDDLNGQVPVGGLGLRSQNAAKEVMTWMESGKVGIGTTTPNYLLELVSSDTPLRSRCTGSGIGVYTSSSSGFGVYSDATKNFMGGLTGFGQTNPTHRVTVNGAIGIQQSGTTKYHIDYAAGGLNFVETSVADYRLFVQNGGNVGIGTGNPSEKLHVAGNAKINGTLTAGDIFSSSLSDETGIVGGSSYAFTSIPNSWTTVASKTINVPGPGWVLAIASAKVELYHGASGYTHCRMGISTISDSIPLTRQFKVGVGSFADAGSYDHTPTCQEVFQVNSSGDHTYYFLAWKNDDNSVYFYRRSLTLIYFPTVYSSKSGEHVSESNQSWNEGAVIHIGASESPPAASKSTSDDELARLRAEIEALRQKVEALDR